MPVYLRRAFSILAIVMLALQVTGQNMDSLKLALENAEGREKIPVLHQLLLGIWLNYPEQAMDYGQQALDISHQFEDSINISKSLRFMAGVYYYKGDFDFSLDYNLRALAIATAIQDSSLINNGFNNIGLLYYNLGSYQTALEYLLRSIQYKKRIGEIYGYATTLNNIGLVYDKINDLSQARENFEEALEMARHTGNKDQEIYSQNNIAATYLKEGQLDLADNYFRGALTLAKQAGNINWGAASMRGMGQLMHQLAQNDSAEHYFMAALSASESIEDKIGLSEVYYLLAALFKDKSELTNAIGFLDKSHATAGQIKLRRQLLDNLKLYIEIHTMDGDSANTIKFQSQYIQFHDSLFQEIEVRNLALVPLKIKDEEDRITFSRQQVELQNKSFINKVFIIIIIISIPFIIFLFVLLRKNITNNRELVKNNQELKRTQNLLIKSEKMASLGVLAAGVGHEINNPLNFIQNGLLGLSNEIIRQHGRVNEELQRYFDIINEGVVRASNIVKSLSHFSRIGVNMDEKCNLHDILENCLTILNNKLKFKVEVVKTYTSEPPIVKGNSGKLHQVFINILSNAEQAIEKQGMISITTSKVGENMSVIIEDTGAGIPAENIQKIGDPFFTTKEPGKGTGLGLFITYSIVHEHNGDIQVSSRSDKGTRFEVLLPLK